MRLIAANIAGRIQAAETIIQGRNRGENRTAPQYRPRQPPRNIN